MYYYYLTIQSVKTTQSSKLQLTRLQLSLARAWLLHCCAVLLAFITITYFHLRKCMEDLENFTTSSKWWLTSLYHCHFYHDH